MDIQEKQARWALEKPLFEAEFIHSHLLPFFNFNENTGHYEIKSEFSEDEDQKVAYKTLNTAWVMWLRAKRAKAQAVPAEFEIGQLKDRITELLDERQDLYAQINAQAVPKWISTSERMPEEGEEVLVHSLGQVRQVTRDSKWAGGFKERNCYGWQAAYGQSHWMPKSIELPEQYHFYYENDAKQKAMIDEVSQ